MWLNFKSSDPAPVFIGLDPAPVFGLDPDSDIFLGGLIRINFLMSDRVFLKGRIRVNSQPEPQPSCLHIIIMPIIFVCVWGIDKMEKNLSSVHWYGYI